MTPVEVLRKAKALIEERGWVQASFQDDDGRLCMLGACRAAVGLRAIPLGDSPSLKDVAPVVTRVLRQVVDGIVNWNDTDGRTKEEVLAAFDKAIALAEAQP